MITVGRPCLSSICRGSWPVIRILSTAVQAAGRFGASIGDGTGIRILSSELFECPTQRFKLALSLSRAASVVATVTCRVSEHGNFV